MKFSIKDFLSKNDVQSIIFLCSVVYKMPYQLVINERFFRCKLETTLHHFWLKSSMRLSTTLWFHVFWGARNNKKYLEINIYLTIHPRCHFGPVLPLHRKYCIVCSAYGFYTTITVPISDTTFSIYYFRHSLRHSSHLFLSFQPMQAYFPKTFNKVTIWKTTNNSHKYPKHIITRKLIRLIFTSPQIYWKKQLQPKRLLLI